MSSQQPQPHQGRSFWVLTVLSMLMGFASISTDLYLPAMPDMQAALLANAGSIEFTDSGYLIGFSLGFVFMSATGFIVANSITGALSIFPESAGAVSALVGATRYGTGVICSALVGAFANGTPGPMGVVIAVFAIGIARFALALRPWRRGRRTTETPCRRMTRNEMGLTTVSA